MKVLCLVDGAVRPPDRWLWNHLDGPACEDDVDFLSASPADSFVSWGKLLGYYPAFLALAAQALRRARRLRYDVLVAWEAKTGFPLAMLRAVLHLRQPPAVTLAFSYKGLARAFVPAGRWFMRGMDHITTPTQAEAAYYHELLAIPSSHISLVHLGGWEAGSGQPAPAASASFIFAGGRTERDYRTFFDAVAGLECPVIVNARPFNLRGLRRPLNVQVNDLMPLPDYWALLRQASLVVVPLKSTPYAAGLSHILQAMSIGRPIIASRTTSTVDYLEPEKTGLLVEPGDPRSMRAAIERLMTCPDFARALGQAAKARYDANYTSRAHAERCYHVICRVAAGA